MGWVIEYTDEFELWWNGLDEEEQESIDASVELLIRFGPALCRPHADQVKASRYSNMKELITQHKGDPYRTLFAFDPRRVAILLIAGNKGGDKRWYKKIVPIADRLYAEHLKEIKREADDG